MPKIANCLNIPASSSTQSLTLGNGRNFLGANILDCLGSAAFGNYAGTSAPSNSVIISGVLGIGTTNPGYNIDFGTSAIGTTTLALYHNSNVLVSFGANNGLISNFPSGAGQNCYWNIIDTGTGAVTELMRLTSGGSLGIGTNGPSNPLSVNGSASIGTYASTSAPSNGLIVSGNVGIGTSSPASSAILTVSSTSQGFLPPVMTSTQKNAISSPTDGLVVYDTTLDLLETYNGTTGLWVPAGNYVLLALTTLGGAASSVTFGPTIPQTYSHLKIYYVTQSSAGNGDVQVQVNGISTSTYDWIQAGGNNGSTFSQASIGSTFMRGGPVQGSTASYPSGGIIDFPFYSLTNFYKYITAVAGTSPENAGTSYVYTAHGSNRATTAISSITLTLSSGNFISGSSFYLYGIL